MVALSALMLLIIFIQSIRLSMFHDDSDDANIAILAAIGFLACVVYMLWNHTI